ncbi:hypothetical protein OPT61_g2814 [Boeremia exigua]|uniref:Uncharacterized protein n=1 Tax=Boeremia exigua TaxID=749465 RepID=A0ACC2IK51_9PLEO|nr:hypothetical protein OPT61_g2814 [Boeremia exigua]
MEGSPPDEAGVSFDFSLPRAFDVPGDLHGTESGFTTDVHNTDEVDFTESDYRQFFPGFSDDEGDGEAFKRSWPDYQAKNQTAVFMPGRKSPKRSDSNDFESNIRAKKSRHSLFGGADEEVTDKDHTSDFFMPAIMGDGIGDRMSSLNLEQQQDGDDGAERAMRTGFGLACSDIGSVCDSSDDELIIPPDPVPYYDFRTNIDRKKAVTHVDNDKSGNWNPDQHAENKTSKMSSAAAKQDKKERRKKKRKNDTKREYVMKCIAKLRFDAFGNVRNITNDEQNWPDGWSEIDPEQERELEEHRVAHRANTPDCRPQRPLEDPANKVDDLTGHPAARGCKQCRKIEQTCSMVNGNAYPCRECVEDGSECQPIQKPAQKGRCKQCEKANTGVCSFETEPSQLICSHCADNDYICEALPPPGYKAARIDLDKEIMIRDHPFISCASCRRSKKRCSLKTMKDQPPCKRCRKEKVICTFSDPPRHDDKSETEEVSLIGRNTSSVANPDSSSVFTKEDLATMERHQSKVRKREPTPELEMEDAEGNRGILIKLTTSFAHPMRFGSQKRHCDFCAIPFFGMVGHFERQVHVIDWHSGQGYAEVGGGHCQHTGETNMCADCTNQRLLTLVCSEHSLERMPGVIPEWTALTEELNAAEPGGTNMRYQLLRWCSLCFSPAEFGCSTIQDGVCEEEAESIVGCNLRLCATCEEALRTVYNGNFDAMATKLDKKPKVSEVDAILERDLEGRPRADVGLLTADGLLIRANNMKK